MVVKSEQKKLWETCTYMWIHSRDGKIADDHMLMDRFAGGDFSLGGVGCCLLLSPPHLRMVSPDVCTLSSRLGQNGKDCDI